MTTTQEHVAIDPATHIGLAALTVSDLERALAFYSDLLGFIVLQRTGGSAVLGVDGSPLLILVEDREAQPWARGYTGLHHIAVLLPSRADLGRLLRRLHDHGVQPIGEDHRVSEAIYFADPDGHAVEVYRDRSPDLWNAMGSDQFDTEGLLAEGEAANRPWDGLPSGTRIGHMHIRVGDIQQAKDFYHGVLGFDVMAEHPDALFVSAGGYHHHIGMNTWFSKGAGAPPEGMTGLRFFTVELPNEEALSAVADRLQAAGHTVERTPGGALARDPWGTKILLRQGIDLDADGAARLDRGA